MSFKKNVLHAFLVFNACLLYAQQNITFEHITSEQGLSQNDINSICQDDDGFIWLGTHDGLNKYDGYSFTTFRPNSNDPNAIPSNLVQVIRKDHSGHLWIINTDVGISCFDTKTEKFTQFVSNPQDPEALPSQLINSLYVDPQNRLWVTSRKGISVLDINKLPESRAFSNYSIDSKSPQSLPNNVLTVFQDSREQIWVGTQHGLFRAFMNSKAEMTFISVEEEEGIEKELRIETIVEDKKGGLLLATEKGLFHKEATKIAGKGSFKRIYEGAFSHIAVDATNNLWVGSQNGLVFLEYDIVNNTFNYKSRFVNDVRNPKSINKNAIRDLFVDASNVVWIGTKGGGVNKMYPEGNPFYTIKKNLNPEGLSYNNVRSLYEDSNNTLWVGTEDGSLNIGNSLGEKNKLQVFDKADEVRNVFAIHEVVDGREKYMLLGSETASSLYRVKIKKGSYSVKDIEFIPGQLGAVFAIQQTRDRNIWIGTYNNGIHRWTPKENREYEKKHFSVGSGGLSSRIIRSFLEDAEGNLWIGTGKGLNMLPKAELSKEDPKFTVFKNDLNDDSSISHDYILGLHQSKDGTIWVGTLGGGLNKYVPASDKKPTHFINYTVKNSGLANDIIKAIEEDGKGNLWISSNNGLTKFNPETKKVRNYDVNDGLQGNEFLELSSFKDKNGQLLFGGINGFNVFNPDQIKDNTIQATPLFTNLLLLNKNVAVGEKRNNRILLSKSLNATEKIVLKPSENSFSIEFSAAHFVSPKKNKFQYKLENFDQDWIDTDAKKRFATYTNLPTGKTYQFKLRVANNDGLWNDDDIKTLQIVMVPPLWNTGWAYFLYGLLALGLLFAFRRYTIVRAEEKHQFDVSKMEKEKSEELQQLKLEFFTNISHEFRTPLTLIKGPLDYLEKNDSELNSEERAKQYDLMNKNANYLLRLVNQLLDFRRLDREKMKLNFSSLNVIEFIEETTGPFLFMANKKNISFSVQSSKKSIVLPFDPDALEKIMNNLLFNAFKFTPENKSITVEILEGESFKNPTLLNKTLDLSSYIVIQIRDTGKGIPPEKIEHIFERYYVERNKNIQGAGIGLSFTKNLVELHQGFIDVKSELGVGTTFSVLLPLKKEEFDKEKIIELEKELSEIELSNLAPDLKSLTAELKADLNKASKPKSIEEEKEQLPKLLIIEDNEDIRAFIKQGLDKNYQILEAENGEQGLEIALTEIPSLIVSDIMMPKLDGLSMSKQLREDKKTSHIPIILLTAKSSTETEREALEIGIEDFVRKPFDLDILVLKIQNIISKREVLRSKYKSTVSLEPEEIAVTSVDEKFLRHAMSIVEDHMMNTEFSVEILVAEMGMSRSNLYLKLKEITGLSSSEFIRSVRLKRAVQLLKKSDMSVKEIMYMTGFNTASYFSKCFKKQYGMVPSDYVKSLNKEKADFKNILDK